MTSTDSNQKRTRFGCGFVFGLLVGGILSMRVLYANGYAIFATCVIIALACAFLAMQFGEYFWRVMKKLSIWWI